MKTGLLRPEPEPAAACDVGRIRALRDNALHSNGRCEPEHLDALLWLVSFMHYDLGFFDHETGRVECAQNPFEPKVFGGLKGSSKHLS
jgi:hypothetical protein